MLSRERLAELRIGYGCGPDMLERIGTSHIDARNVMSLLDHIAAQEALIERLTKALEEIRNGTDDVMVENAAYVALADVRSATNG